MKKITLLLAMLFVTGFSGYAQKKDNLVETPKLSENVGAKPIQKGNWLVGATIGSMGYSFEQESFNVNINPNAGYFITDGIAVGLKIGAGLQTVKKGDNVWSYEFKPFGRYYFPEGASETGRFFGQADIGITGYSGTTSDTSFAFGVAGGYSHFVSRNVALEGTLGYNYSKSDVAGAEAQNGLGFAVGLQIFLGK